MAKRQPVVLGSDNLTQQLQPGDTTGINAYFTASNVALPSVLALGNSTVTMTVTPAISGDSLVAGERISIVPTSALPSGMGICWFLVSATNTVQMNVMALIAISTATRTFSVTAHR